MIVGKVILFSLKFPDSAFFTASQTWTILFGSRSRLRYATFHFLSCFPSALSCGVYNWNSLHVCWCDGAIVIPRPCVSFFYHQPSRWIKLSKSIRNVFLETCLPFRSAFDWLLVENNPLNLRHNGCYWTVAIDIPWPFHTKYHIGENPCVRSVLMDLAQGVTGVQYVWLL